MRTVSLPMTAILILGAVALAATATVAGGVRYDQLVGPPPNPLTVDFKHNWAPALEAARKAQAPVERDVDVYVTTQGQPFTGTGTQEDPYVRNNVLQLQILIQTISGSFPGQSIRIILEDGARFRTWKDGMRGLIINADNITVTAADGGYWYLDASDPIDLHSSAGPVQDGDVWRATLDLLDDDLTFEHLMVDTDDPREAADVDQTYFERPSEAAFDTSSAPARGGQFHYDPLTKELTFRPSPEMAFPPRLRVVATDHDTVPSNENALSTSLVVFSTASSVCIERCVIWGAPYLSRDQNIEAQHWCFVSYAENNDVHRFKDCIAAFGDLHVGGGLGQGGGVLIMDGCKFGPILYHNDRYAGPDASSVPIVHYKQTGGQETYILDCEQWAGVTYLPDTIDSDQRATTAFFAHAGSTSPLPSSDLFYVRGARVYSGAGGSAGIAYDANPPGSGFNNLFNIDADAPISNFRAWVMDSVLDDEGWIRPHTKIQFNVDDQLFARRGHVYINQTVRTTLAPQLHLAGFPNSTTVQNEGWMVNALFEITNQDTHNNLMLSNGVALFRFNSGAVIQTRYLNCAWDIDLSNINRAPSPLEGDWGSYCFHTASSMRADGSIVNAARPGPEYEMINCVFTARSNTGWTNTHPIQLGHFPGDPTGAPYSDGVNTARGGVRASAFYGFATDDDIRFTNDFYVRTGVAQSVNNQNSRMLPAAPDASAGAPAGDLIGWADPLPANAGVPQVEYDRLDRAIDTAGRVVGPIGIAATAACSPADVATDGQNTQLPDGLVTLTDFSTYLNFWAQGDPRADITPNDTCKPGPPHTGDSVTLTDFSCYLSIWSQGCP
ncbi:MAG: GC-type dockerin domain-anchored protein [Planctomycetota bacterium]